MQQWTLNCSSFAQRVERPFALALPGHVVFAAEQPLVWIPFAI